MIKFVKRKKQIIDKIIWPNNENIKKLKIPLFNIITKSVLKIIIKKLDREITRNLSLEKVHLNIFSENEMKSKIGICKKLH